MKGTYIRNIFKIFLMLTDKTRKFNLWNLWSTKEKTTIYKVGVKIPLKVVLKDNNLQSRGQSPLESSVKRQQSTK